MNLRTYQLEITTCTKDLYYFFLFSYGLYFSFFQRIQILVGKEWNQILTTLNEGGLIPRVEKNLKMTSSQSY